MRPERKDKTKKEFDELLLEVRRVTRVTTWWRRMSFRATVLIWNKKWKIWIWLSKWPDVSTAVNKASNEAYKKIFNVPITKNQTVPYPISMKYKACLIKLLPASAGTWIKAWSSVRSVLELAWYENVLSKIVWSNNKLNNAIATINALITYKHADHFNNLVIKKPEKKIEETIEETAIKVDAQPNDDVELAAPEIIVKVKWNEIPQGENIKETPKSEEKSEGKKEEKKIIWNSQTKPHNTIAKKPTKK